MNWLSKTEELVKIAQNTEAFLRPIALAVFLGTVATFCIYRAVQALAIKPTMDCCKKVHGKLTQDKRKKASLYEDLKQLTEHQIKEYFLNHYSYKETYNMLVYVSKKHNKNQTEFSRNLCSILKNVCSIHPTPDKVKIESSYE